MSAYGPDYPQPSPFGQQDVGVVVSAELCSEITSLTVSGYVHIDTSPNPSPN